MSEDKVVPDGDKNYSKTRTKSKPKRDKKRKRNNTEKAEDNGKAKRKPLNLENEEEEEIDDDTNIEGVKTESKTPSKRQLKRDKAEKRFTEQRETSKLEATQKALNYISKWKHAKSEWKFEKLRQIWLMDNLLDENLVPETIFPTVLEYFEGCKGMARQQLVKKMMEVIRKVEESEESKKNQEDNEEEMEDSEKTNSSEYQRARKILQALPTEG